MKKAIRAGIVLVALSIVGWALLDSTSEADALSNGVSFGAFSRPVNGQNNIAALEALENDLGTTLPLIRGFSNWDDNIGNGHSLHRWARDGDRDLIVSVKAQRNNGEVVTWRSIANAQPGSRIYREMQDLASGIEGYGRPITVIFHHEPETGDATKFGDADDYRAAFRKLDQVLRDEGASNARLAWVITNFSFDLAERRSSDRPSACTRPLLSSFLDPRGIKPASSRANACTCAASNSCPSSRANACTCAASNSCPNASTNTNTNRANKDSRPSCTQGNRNCALLRSRRNDCGYRRRRRHRGYR